MANRRMISKCLSTSRKFSELLTDSARMMFPLLVIHADDFGRLDGQAFWVKHNCAPTLPHLTEDKVEDVLQDMARVGLIKRALIQDILVIQICQFDEHQGGLHKRTKSKFPEVPGSSEKFPLKGTEGKGTEGKGNKDLPPRPPVPVPFKSFETLRKEEERADIERIKTQLAINRKKQAEEAARLKAERAAQT